jgi:hypothetical protein
MNESSMKRLLIAALAALVVMGLLAFASGYIPGAKNLTAGALGHVDPVNSLVTAIAMCLGGYLGGKRFILVALLLMIIMWIATIIVMLQVGVQVEAKTLGSVLAYNRSQILFSLLAATAGAAIGAWLQMKRAPARVQ